MLPLAIRMTWRNLDKLSIWLTRSDVSSGWVNANHCHFVRDYIQLCNISRYFMVLSLHGYLRIPIQVAHAQSGPIPWAAEMTLFISEKNIYIHIFIWRCIFNSPLPVSYRPVQVTVTHLKKRHSGVLSCGWYMYMVYTTKLACSVLNKMTATSNVGMHHE